MNIIKNLSGTVPTGLILDNGLKYKRVGAIGPKTIERDGYIFELEESPKELAPTQLKKNLKPTVAKPETPDALLARCCEIKEVLKNQLESLNCERARRRILGEHIGAVDAQATQIHNMFHEVEMQEGNLEEMKEETLWQKTVKREGFDTDNSTLIINGEKVPLAELTGGGITSFTPSEWADGLGEVPYDDVV